MKQIQKEQEEKNIIINGKPKVKEKEEDFEL